MSSISDVQRPICAGTNSTKTELGLCDELKIARAALTYQGALRATELTPEQEISSALDKCQYVVTFFLTRAGGSENGSKPGSEIGPVARQAECVVHAARVRRRSHRVGCLALLRGAHDPGGSSGPARCFPALCRE